MASTVKMGQRWRKKEGCYKGVESRDGNFDFCLQVGLKGGKSNAQGEIRHYFLYVVVHGKEKSEKKIGQFCLFE